MASRMMAVSHAGEREDYSLRATGPGRTDARPAEPLASSARWSGAAGSAIGDRAPPSAIRAAKISAPLACTFRAVARDFLPSLLCSRPLPAPARGHRDHAPRPPRPPAGSNAKTRRPAYRGQGQGDRPRGFAFGLKPTGGISDQAETFESRRQKILAPPRRPIEPPSRGPIPSGWRDPLAPHHLRRSKNETKIRLPRRNYQS